MLINLDALKNWTKYESSKAIQRWLDEHGISYFTTPSGEICTTEDAINDRLISKKTKRKIEFK